jgi:DNA-directed RNA polymerase subunit RPC12/RpoP
VSKEREIEHKGVKIRHYIRVGDNQRKPVWLDDDERRQAFKGDCPSCSAPMIAMSEIRKDEPTTRVEKGDVIKCDHCSHNALVEAVNQDNRLQLCKLPVPSILNH